MAIATRTPVTDVTPKPTMPYAYTDNYKGLMYDNNHTPLVSLISYMDGSPWTVQSYFRQSLGEHNDLKMLDTVLDAEFQGYERIDKLEILVDTDLQSSSDTVQQVTKTNGAGMIYPFFVPNVNDYFIAVTGFRNMGLFRVTNVDRRTFRTDSVHYIEYTMVGYLDDLPNEAASLKEKTVRTYVFSRERLMEGLAPILKTEVFEAIGDLRYEYEAMGRYYLDNFLDRGAKTLIYPGQTNHRIYDPFLVQFVMQTFSYDTFDAIINMKQLNKDGNRYLDQPQFWDVMINQNWAELKFCNQVMGFARTGQFDPNTYIKSLAFQRVDYVVFPDQPDISTRSYDDELPLPVVKGIAVKTTNGRGKTLTTIEKSYSLANKLIPSYPMILDDEHYVLSKNFYDNKGSDLSLLEIMTRDYIHRRTLDLKQILHMVKLYPSMERLEQFYYIPILMTLVRYFEKSAYT